MKIYPQNLHDIGKRATARTKELWCSDFEVRLYPRYRPDAPHFFSRSSNRYIDKRKEKNDSPHDERIENLLEQLNDSNLKVGTLVFDEGESQFETLTSCDGYSWGGEVTRVLSQDVKCRHDIFGQPGGHNLVVGSPWVAIEVIDSHYPDEKTLEGMISLSARLPFLVLFDIVAEADYFFQIDEKSKSIRVIYYISDGAVWKNGSRWKRCTAAFLEEKIKDHIRYYQEKKRLETLQNT